MSEPRVAALVCEGQTDVPILRAVLQEVWPELEQVLCLQPELDETDRAKGAAGWNQVRAWCKAHAGNLTSLLDPDVGDRIDLLVIVIDVDIAIEAGITNPPQSIGLYETSRLRDTMEGWLTTSERPNLPGAILLSTPVMAVESWIIAALFPKARTAEAIADPAQWLVDKGKLMKSPVDGRPWKELYRYRDDFAPTVAKQLGRVRKACAEANRMLRAVERRRLELQSG